MEHFWRRTISRKYYSHFQLYMDRSNAVKIPSRIFLVSINSPNDSTKSPNKNPSNDRPIIYHRKYFPYHTDLPHPRIRSNIVMWSRGQRRFPGIVITTFKRRRVNLVEWGPLCPFPSVLLSSVLCFTSAHHGLCLWETPSGRCQHLTPSDHFFSSLFIFIFIIIIELYPPNVQLFETYFARYLFPSFTLSTYFSFFPFFFIVSASLHLRNSRRNYRKWGRGQLFKGFFEAQLGRTVVEKLAGGFEPLDTLLCLINHS